MVAPITALLLALTFVHDLDHVRQGRPLDAELYVVGVLAVVTTFVTLVLAARRHPLANDAAILLGVITVVGVAAVHVAPARVVLSDSYGAAHVDIISWTVVVAIMVTALALAIAGAHGRQ